MLRVVFAVALATVLVATTLPAVEDARQSTAAAAVTGDAATLERAAASLLATDEDAPGPGARRTVTLSLPSRSWTGAGVAYVAVGGPPDGPVVQPPERGVVRYRVAGGRERRLLLDVPVRTRGGPLVLREPGPHRLVLRLTTVDGRRVVVVSEHTPGGTTDGGAS